MHALHWRPWRFAPIAAAALVLGCNEGFDPGMHSRCMWGNRPPDANFVHDTTDCPTVDYNNDANAHWIIGANKGRCGGRHDLPIQITNIDSVVRKMQLTWFGDPTSGYTALMHHGGATVCPGAIEDDFSMVNSVPVKLVTVDGHGVPHWLHSHHEMQLQGHGGMFQLSVALSFAAGGYDRWLEISFRPRNPWWTQPAPGHVVFKGSDGLGTRICTLDAQWFGIPGLCPNGCPGPWTNVDIDWSVVLNDAINSCWPALAGTDFGAVPATYTLETAGYARNQGGVAGTMTLAHHGWKMYR